MNICDLSTECYCWNYILCPHICAECYCWNYILCPHICDVPIFAPYLQEWPEVKIIFRGDSGFCRWKLMSWCDRNNVKYIIGLSKNNRLNSVSSALHKQAEVEYQQSKEKQRLFCSLDYGAATWDKPRRVIVKSEHS